MARMYIDRLTVGDVVGYFRETLYGSGAPSGTLDAFPGQRYFDVYSKKTYVCMSVSSGVSVWEPYMLNDDERAVIVDAVLSALPMWEGGSY